MRFVDKTFQALGQPVIAPRLALVAVQSLLNHDPVPVVGDNKAVQIKLETILDGGAVDLGNKAARGGKLAAAKPTRSPMVTSSSGVCRECFPRPPQT